MRNMEKATLRPKTAGLQPMPGFGQHYEPLLSDAEMVEFFGGLHIKTVQRIAQHGVLPFYRVGKHYFYVTPEMDSDFEPDEEIA